MVAETDHPYVQPVVKTSFTRPMPQTVQIDAQIERFSGLTFHWLSFPRDLEDRFESQTSTARAKRLGLEGLLATSS